MKEWRKGFCDKFSDVRALLYTLLYCTDTGLKIIQPFTLTHSFPPLKTSLLILLIFFAEKGNFIDFFQFPDSQQERGARNDTKPKTSLIFSQLI